MSSDIDHAVSDKKLHIAMFPWLAFGHIIPFLQLAKLIAQKGHKVSFISTPKNIQCLPKIPQHLKAHIDLVELPLPYEPNLPENAESTMEVPTKKVTFLKKAHDGLEHDMLCFLESSTPDWIIHDFAPYWLPSIATKLSISRCYFSIFNAWTYCFFEPISPEIRALYQDQPRTKPEHLTVPPEWIPFPSKLALRPFDAKKIFDSFEENVVGLSDWERLVATTLDCDVFAFRSCMELEAEWLNLFPKMCNRPQVIPLGLIPPSILENDWQNKLDDDDRDWGSIVAWLDTQENGSVLYVALGSEARPCQEDFNELALGLELSRLPFFWALRKGNGAIDGHPVELPEGFEERTRNHGYVCSSWAPQVKILAHQAVGGFLTHGGLSSIVEGLQFGCVLVMLPFFGDQGLNVSVWKDKNVGVEIPRNENNGSFSKEDVAESIRLVMVDEGGKLYRDKAKEMSLMTGNKDLHQEYIDKFVSYLENHS